jgi:hypothetical protein
VPAQRAAQAFEHARGAWFSAPHPVIHAACDAGQMSRHLAKPLVLRGLLRGKQQRLIETPSESRINSDSSAIIGRVAFVADTRLALL